MALIFGKEMTKEALLKRVGHISQIGGVRVAELQDGLERGVRIVDVVTGSGLQYTVLVDRGLDIAWTSYKGVSIGWRSHTENLSPFFFEPEGLGWLRGFHGGLMNTCGLTYAGAPCQDVSTHPFMSEENLGLHGRVSYLPASNLVADGYWQGDDYVMEVSGKIREAIVFGDKLVMRRRISSRLGEKVIHIEDEILNDGWQESPFMILYHINIGYPILDEGSTLLLPVVKTVPRDAQAEDGKEYWNTFQGPQKGYYEKVYLHYPKILEDGYGASLLLNEQMGLGVYVKFDIQALPYFTEWKMIGEGEYVVGMEPGNCFPLGRKIEREADRLSFLKPQESRKIKLEIGVVEGDQEISRFKKYLGMD